MTQKQFTLEDFPLQSQFSEQYQEQSLSLEPTNTMMEDCQDIMFTFSNRSRKISLDQPFSQQGIQSYQFAEQQQTDQFFSLNTQQNSNFLFTLPAPTENNLEDKKEEEEEKITTKNDYNQESSSSDPSQQFPDIDFSFDPFQIEQQQIATQKKSFEDLEILNKPKTSNLVNPFVTKISKRQAKKKGNYDKNICRYLTRKTIRCFASAEYKEKALQFAHYDEDLYFEATEFFLRKIEKITGFRVLKQYLQIPKLSEIAEDDEETLMERQYSIVFKRFYLWFLQERMTRYILNGKMEDKQMYIKYKNEVMLNYSDALDSWTSNKNLKKKERK